MPKAPKPPLTPVAASARPLAISALLLGLGQWVLFSGQMALGLGLTLLACLPLALDLFIPARSKALPGLEPKLAKPSTAKAGVKAATKGGGRPLAAMGLKERLAELALLLQNLRPALERFNSLLSRRWLPMDELTLSRWWLLVPVGLFAVHGQLGLAKGKLVTPIAELVVAAMFVGVFLQGLGRAIVIPRLNQNLRAVLLAALGLPLQILGAMQMWQYVSVITGFLLVLAGGLWTLYSLSRWPIELQSADEIAAAPTQDEWHLSQATPFYSWQNWRLKLWYILGSAISAYLCYKIFAGQQEGWSVSMGFISIALLLMSFPWLPGSLGETLGLGPKPKALMALLAVLLALALGWRGQKLIEMGQISRGLWWFLAAGLAAMVASSARPLERQIDSQEPKPARWLEMTLFFSVVAIALALRAWKLGSFPYAAEGDEAGGGIYGMDVLLGRVENHLITGNVPLHFFSVTAFFYKIAGLSIGAMRTHSVVMGTLSIAATYFFFRLTSGWATALIATVLMTGSYWHLHYSRFGHYNIEQVFMQMVAFYFIWKGLRERRVGLSGIGGLAFGLAMLPHLASRLLPFQGIALLGYLFISNRVSLRRHAPSLIAFIIGAWIMASPGLTYWFRATAGSFGRASSVSIFDKTNTNAPPDVLSGFVRNCKVSMLMFNHVGDNRPRDNPVAPDKILERGMAILFAIAFAYGLCHWRQPLRFFLLAVFFINLSASIFSVEAPQTLRSAGNIPIVFAFIALWLGDVAKGLQGFGRVPGMLLFLALFLPLSIKASYTSLRIYFVDKASQAFDIAPTYVAMKVGELSDKVGKPVKGIFAATGFAASHPPVMLFRKSGEMATYFNLAEFLPPTEADKDLALMLVDDYQVCVPLLKEMFPDSPVEVIKNGSRVGGPDIASYVHVDAASLAKRQGLRAMATIGGKTRELLNVPVDTRHPSLLGATRVTWRGTLVLKQYGHHKFRAAGGGSLRMVIDGKPLAGGTDMALAMGAHRVEIEWSADKAGQTMNLQWERRPVISGMVFSVNAGGLQDVPFGHFWMDYRPRGFYGRYWTGQDFSGQPVTETIEPVLFARWLDPPIQGRWCAQWKGRFNVKQAGHYRFQAPVAGQVEIRVDGKLVGRNGGPMLLNAPLVSPQDGIQLSPGPHLLDYRYTTAGNPWVELRWSGPGFQNEVFQDPSLEPVRD